MLDKFAEELREARIKSGVSLQQMSTRTRIDLKFLEAIDKGDFIFLPEPYVKAFLKDYAKMVGLDEVKTIQKYEAAKKGRILEEKPEPQNVETKMREEKPAESDRTEVKSALVQTYDATPPETPVISPPDLLRKNIILGSIIGGSILLLGLIYLIFFRSNSEIVVAEKPIEEIIENNQERYVEEPADTGTDISQAISSDSIALNILSEDTTWVKIVLDDNESEEFILFPNSQKAIKTKNNYKITLGNPRGIKFKLNNKPLNFTGREGSVTHVLIDRNGLQYDNSPSPTKQADTNLTRE